MSETRGLAGMNMLKQLNNPTEEEQIAMDENNKCGQAASKYWNKQLNAPRKMGESRYQPKFTNKIS